MTGRDLDVIALLGVIHPAWSYEVSDVSGLPRWRTHRNQPITGPQHTAGAWPSIGRSTPERPTAALAVHAEILDRVRP